MYCEMEWWKKKVQGTHKMPNMIFIFWRAQHSRCLRNFHLWICILFDAWFRKWNYRYLHVVHIRTHTFCWMKIMNGKWLDRKKKYMKWVNKSKSFVNCVYTCKVTLTWLFLSLSLRIKCKHRSTNCFIPHFPLWLHYAPAMVFYTVIFLIQAQMCIGIRNALLSCAS